MIGFPCDGPPRLCRSCQGVLYLLFPTSFCFGALVAVPTRGGYRIERYRGQSHAGTVLRLVEASVPLPDV